MQARILQLSPFSTQVGRGLDWDRWSACKHLIRIVCDEAATTASQQTPLAAVAYVKGILQQAVTNLAAIASTGLRLRDGTDVYQANWLAAMEEVEQEKASDFDYLLLVKP